MEPDSPVLGPSGPRGSGPRQVRDQDKIMLILAYLGIFLAPIPLLTVKDSEEVQWHAKNGFTLAVLEVMLVGLLIILVGVGWILLMCFVGPALLVLHVVAMVKALGGERWRIPGVSDLAEKF